MEIFAMMDLREEISNWADKTVRGVKVDNILQIEAMPLSWFFRPILYSNLLPKPFPTTSSTQYNILKVKSFSLLFRKSLLMFDRMKSGTAKTAPPNVLFLTFSNQLVGKIPFRERKVIEQLRQASIYPLCLGVDPITSLPNKKLKNLDYTLYQYYDQEIKEASYALSNKLHQTWLKIKEQVLQGNLKPFEENLNFIYSQEFLYLTAKYYFSFKKAIEQSCAIVVSSQNNIIEKCLIAAAHKLDKPVFIIQHGIGLGTFPTIDTPNNVRFAVFSQKYKDELVALGVRKENIAITGPIILDGIEKFKSPVSGEKILFATSALVEDRFMEKEEYFIKLRNIFSQLKDRQVVLKLHPREKHRDSYQQIIDELNLSIKIVVETDREKHYQLIKDSALVITFGSTVSLEAMIIGRPTLTIELFDGVNPTNSNVRDPRATTMVKYSDEIAPHVHILLQGETKDPETLVNYLCSEVGGAAGRIKDYILGQ
jgi:hypothetical protein